MKSPLFFDFTVDKATNTIHITRQFDAELPLVWDAWTKADLLNQWWAPKPYHIETKTLELREGGRWLYAMVSPQNEKMWCKADYQQIDPCAWLSWLDAFCDEEGIENTIKPRSTWNIRFTADNHITTVDITLLHDQPEAVDMMINMGFKEGFAMAIGNLDQLLQEMSTNR